MSFMKRRRFVSVVGRKSNLPPGLWMKCHGCQRVVYLKDVQENKMVCTRCGFHYKVKATQRIDWIVDEGSFEETHGDIVSANPLNFELPEVSYSYNEKLEAGKRKSGLNEAMVTGFAAVDRVRTVIGAMEFRFCGASMGSVVGEKFCLAADDACEHNLPLVMICASGGARMQEGILALMQMAKTADAVHQMNEAGVPYISLLVDPTSGGVYASFASLGDVTLAEPGAYVGFAGARLIEGALKVKLPEGFQTAEYQHENGFVDMVVPRTELRETIGRLLKYLSPQERGVAAASA
jgi:acetyl-CoA carboxylase carboxyl transferase subunit beta